ncbi:unnamed protein product [Arctogadus glacialis]
MSRSVTTEPGLEPAEGEEEEAEGDCFEDGREAGSLGGCGWVVGLRCRPSSRLRSLPGWEQQHSLLLLSPPGPLYVSSTSALRQLHVSRGDCGQLGLCSHSVSVQGLQRPTAH